MPLWAIFYCGMIVLSAFFTISVFVKRGSYYIPGQLMSSLFSVLMFLFYYGTYIQKPQSLFIVLCMFLYIIYWEVWENRVLFPVIAEDTDDLSTTNFDLTQQQKVSQNMYIVMMTFVVVISLPLLYVTLSLVRSYV
jgi:hypothetical protein